MPFWRKTQARELDHREASPASIGKWELKHATRTRKTWALISSFLFLITVVFLILVEVGMTSEDRLPNVYFIKLDLTQIVPTSLPNARLLSTIAQTLGLHDFYQVGLWNYCAGYVDQGITTCSEPQTLFWFNPIAVIQGELLAGASIPFPDEVQDVLHILRIASQWMFALFLTGACLSFVMIFITPLAIYSKLASIPVTILTFLATLTTTVAAVLGTAIFVIFRNAARAQTDVNLGAEIGTEMFAFMWVAAGASLFAFLIQFCLLCCCRSRRKARKEFRKSREAGVVSAGGLTGRHHRASSSTNEKEEEDSARRV